MDQRTSQPSTAALVAQSLRSWTGRHLLVATSVSLVMALLVGFATVLIPNDVFSREIPPVWWNYPVWIVTSVLTGVLVATYVRDGRTDDPDPDPSAVRTSRLGVAGGVLAWFAVGCPVCNKLALVALGYSGAISYFAPLQPFLAAAALALTAGAVVVRLRNQALCPLPRRETVMS